jgi:hypothetical protein
MMNDFLETRVPGTMGYVKVFSGVTVHLPEMPNKFHQFMMKLFFGFKFTNYSERVPFEINTSVGKTLLLG